MASPARSAEFDPRTSTGPALVEAIGITKRFGPTVALDDVRLSITQGRTHALVGRNGAGKSTLVSVLTGLLAPDDGQVLFGGESAPAMGNREAWQTKVACVYQHSTIIPDLSVAENLFINRQTDGHGLIRWKSLRRRAREILDLWSVPVDERMEARDLDVEQRQMVEIARSLSYGARFIILDEPTAKLDGAAIKRLFIRIRDLQTQGVTFLFISHHLAETYEICQDITVYRDARYVITAAAEDLSHDQLVEAMTGEANLSADLAKRDVPSTEKALEVVGLGRPPEFQDISFSVRRGEIVGLAGGGASGKAAVGETIVGLRKAHDGSITVGGVVPRRGSVRAGLDAGIGFVPQDRHHQGLVMTMSVADNVTLTIPAQLGPVGLLAPRVRDTRARSMIADLDIKTSGPEQDVDGLSGGNQQKVVMARALANDPSLLVLISPTAGVDVRSKQTLLDVVRRIGDDGAGVLIVSDELDDLRDCDRVLVMFQGTISHELNRGWADNELVAAMEGLAP
ncbi:simple sugar transport system ATP-binding protein [Nakamurella sp. UYEF19]|uniref:sugar ABC transporter ATP-binding protein n=1 Tax=Nakamurella sp. UYEF19 TaxID=1756392 RepID=UPI0033911E85